MKVQAPTVHTPKKIVKHRNLKFLYYQIFIVSTVHVYTGLRIIRQSSDILDFKAQEKDSPQYRYDKVLNIERVVAENS